MNRGGGEGGAALRRGSRGLKRPFLVEGPRPLPIAHRGGAGVFPENTLVAFEGAVEMAYRWVELDVHLSRDGELVVIHDPTVDRTTDGEGRVDGFTAAELGALDAGYRFTRDGGATFPFRGRGIGVPTLDEVFRALPDATRVVVEMKPEDRDVARAVHRFLETRTLQDRVVVAHGHGPTLRSFRRLSRGRVATSASKWEIVRFWLLSRLGLEVADLVPYDALQVPEAWRSLRCVDDRFLRAAHRRGLAVQVWTIDDEDDLRRLAQLGVDGLITDRPDTLLRVIQLQE